MPTREEMDAVQRRIEDLTVERFRLDGNMMRPSDAADGVPWDGLSQEQRIDVLSSSVNWMGFSADQQVEVVHRVMDGEPSVDWMGDIVASDQREHNQAAIREQREEKWAADHGRLPTPEEMDRDVEALRAVPEAAPARGEEPASSVLPITEAELDGIEAGWRGNGGPGLPLDQIEREVQRIKVEPYHVVAVETSGPMVEMVNIGAWEDWAEPQRLHALEGMVRWDGVEVADKRRILEREVDFAQVSPEDQQRILGEVWQQNDAEPFGRSGNNEEPSRDAPETDWASIRPLTKELITCCLLDVWPGIATVTDFGLVSSSHLGALQFAIREELVTAQELDAAMGNGEKLTEIAQRGDNPYGDVTFKTPWDQLRPEPEDFSPPGGSEPPLAAPAKTAYDRRLQEAAEHGMSLPRDPDRGRDR